MKRLFTAACVAFSATLASAGTEVVPELPVAGDTTIEVPSGTTRRIEYLSGTDSATVTKTGGGTLEIAVVGNANIAFAVQEGTLRSVRPGRMREIAGAYFHVDASDVTGMDVVAAGGTNFVSRWGDVDGRAPFAQSLPGKPRPFLAEGALNGLQVMDFGGFSSTEGVGRDADTAAYMDWNEKRFVRESFWVWKDHDGLKDLASDSQNDFYGPTPVLLGAALYRGKGGNGKDFLFSNVEAPESLKLSAAVDGVALSSPTAARIGEGWHVASVRMPGTYTGSYDLDKDYGGAAFGRRTYTPPSGGFQMAEAVFCTNVVSDADAAYLNAYLRCKWFAASVGDVTVAKGATLDVAEVPLRIGRLQVVDAASVAGLDNLRASEVFCPSNTMLSAGATFHAVDFAESATPNLAFAGDGEIAVASGRARGNMVEASGTLAKTGIGELELSYLTEGVTGLSVTEGALTLSPLLSSASVLHFDASQFVTTEDVDGKAVVTRWDDVNAGRGGSLKEVADGYAFDRSRPVNRPCLVPGQANGLPLVDFGGFADMNHPDGHGAGLQFTRPLAGGKSSLTTNDGWLQAFAVWQDDESASALGLVDGSEFVGPCLFGSNWSWTRGKGGGGNGFPLAGTTSSDFRQSLKLDGVLVPPAECGSRRVPSGLHLLDTRPGCQDGLSGVQVVGCKVGAKESSYYGGVKFGEFLFFRHYIPEGQRQKIAAALGVKWFGTDAYRLAQTFGSVSVADGARASFPYADVTVTNLTASGEVSARSLTVAAGGRLIVTGDAESVSCLTANALRFEGSGVIELSAPALGGRVERAVKVASVPNGPETPVRVPGWRVPSAGILSAGGLLERRQDGYYLVPPRGATIVIR